MPLLVQKFGGSSVATPAGSRKLRGVLWSSRGIPSGGGGFGHGRLTIGGAGQ